MSSELASRSPGRVSDQVLSGTIITHSDAEFRFTHIQDAVENFHVLLAEAIRADDWATLGYPDLATWYQNVTAGRGISPQARGELALALRDRNYSLRAIGGILHVARSTVSESIALASGGERRKHRRAPGSPFAAQVRKGGRVTLPSEIREALRAGEGDELAFTVVREGVVEVSLVPDGD